MRNWWLISLCGILLASCEDPKPAMSGRLSAPADMDMFRGCPQKVPNCNMDTLPQHLLLVVNSLENVLRILHVEDDSFFQAPNPLFPLSIPVGEYPTNLVIDPWSEYAFVVNSLSGDLSVVDLDPLKFSEVDTDSDPCTSFCGDVCPQPQGSEYVDQRCLAGISRVILDPLGHSQPEDVATIPGQSGQASWDRTEPLPVYVSLTGTGQLAELVFTYPDPDENRVLSMELIQILEVGGSPSGLAITQDGDLLFAADETSDSIIAIHTSNMTFERIVVGHPSRRLALSPDEAVLYVVSQCDGRISLVDVDTLQIKYPGQAREEAVDPEQSGETGFKLMGIPRSITFAYGVTINVLQKGGDEETKAYTTELLTPKELEKKKEEDENYEEQVVKTFAFISNLDGRVDIIDAVNHRLIDGQPHVGATCSSGSVSLLADQEGVDKEDLLACVGDPNCQYPMLVEYDRFDGEDEDDEVMEVFNGIFTHTGQTREENWTVTWEGVLPDSKNSSSGVFVGWSLLDDQTGLDFISYGVQSGDILEVTVDPVADQQSCQQVSREYEIETVESNRLVLSPTQGPEPVLCWPNGLEYQVRGVQSWVVVGSRSGLMERAPMLPWQQELPGTHPFYDNGMIGFTMLAPGVNPDTQQTYTIKRDTTWSCSVNDGFSLVFFQPAYKYNMAGTLVSIDTSDGDDQAREDDYVFVLYQASNLLMRFNPNDLKSSNIKIFR